MDLQIDACVEKFKICKPMHTTCAHLVQSFLRLPWLARLGISPLAKGILLDAHSAVHSSSGLGSSSGSSSGSSFSSSSSSSSSSGSSGSPGMGCGSGGFIGSNSGKMSGLRLGFAFIHSCSLCLARSAFSYASRAAIFPACLPMDACLVAPSFGFARVLVLWDEHCFDVLRTCGKSSGFFSVSVFGSGSPGFGYGSARTTTTRLAWQVLHLVIPGRYPRSHVPRAGAIFPTGIVSQSLVPAVAFHVLLPASTHVFTLAIVVFAMSTCGGASSFRVGSASTGLASSVHAPPSHLTRP